MTFAFGVLAGVVLTALGLAFDADDGLYEDERRDC